MKSLPKRVFMLAWMFRYQWFQIPIIETDVRFWYRDGLEAWDLLRTMPKKETIEITHEGVRKSQKNWEVKNGVH